jgi:HAD superfamily hydrolase (TIGR01509 family)
MTQNQPTADAARRAVVFDLDGLLIDTEWAFAEAARRVLARRGKNLDPDFFATMMGTPARDALPRFRERYAIEDSLEVLADQYREAFSAVFDGRFPPLMPGATELIARLEQNGIPKAIATSSSRRYVDGVFGPHGLMHRFEFILTCDDVTHGKPHPEVYILAAERLRLAPGNVVVLEDSVNGTKAAKAARCKCAVVPHDHTPRTELAIADLVTPRLDDAAIWELLNANN